MRDFQENHFDKHLRVRAIQVGDHLADILAGLLIRDDDQPARFGVARNHRLADGAVAVILASCGAAGTEAPRRAAGGWPRRRRTHGLRANRSCRAPTESQAASEISSAPRNWFYHFARRFFLVFSGCFLPLGLAADLA